MKKLLFLFLFISEVGLAQQLDSLVSDTSDVAPPKHSLGAFIHAGINITPNPQGSGLMSTFGVGFKFNRIEAGFSISSYDGDYQKRLIFPNTFSLIYKHGGVSVSYSIIETKLLNFSPFGSFQLGDMVWERSDTGEDFLREKFRLLQFGVSVQTPYLKYLKPELKIGYQSMSGLELVGVSNENFKGVFVGFNVKVGYFNQ